LYAATTALLLIQDGINLIIISGVFSVWSELGNKETENKKKRTNYIQSESHDLFKVGRQKNIVLGPTRRGNKNDRAGEGQQQFT
jgi:hypothetical protein